MPLLTVKLAKEVFGYHTTLWGIGKPALVASHMEGAIQNKCLGKLLMHLTQQVDLQELTAALSTCWQGAICYKLEHTVPLFNNSSLRIWITFLPCWTWESAVIQCVWKMWQKPYCAGAWPLQACVFIVVMPEFCCSTSWCLELENHQGGCEGRLEGWWSNSCCAGEKRERLALNMEEGPLVLHSPHMTGLWQTEGKDI